MVLGAWLLNLNALSELEPYAARYVWWKTAAEAMETPSRVIAQVMDIGDWDDVQRLLSLVGEDELRAVLAQAEPGQFRPRSWAYWSYRLGVVSPDEPPPPAPSRRMA